MIYDQTERNKLKNKKVAYNIMANECYVRSIYLYKLIEERKSMICTVIRILHHLNSTRDTPIIIYTYSHIHPTSVRRKD